MPSGSSETRREEDFWPAMETDLAAIRKLLESESCTGTCPSCKMPFDKGKKRKLIDSCGHERCYSCMFRNEACPLCACAPDSLPPKKSINSQDGLYGEVKGAGQHVRSKMKTNGHFTSYMQSRQESAGLSPEWCQSPNRLPKTRPPTSRSGSLARQDVMTQSCPTPPQNRRKFFLSPKSLRGAWGQKGDQVGPPRLPADIVDNPSALSDDEGGSIRPVGHTKKSSQSDLYMRLGLLLGDNARRASRSAALSPPPRRPGSSTNHSHGSCASFSSLASLEATTLTSTNTSPVSTLTEQQICAHTTHPGIKLLFRALIGMLCPCVDSRILGGRRTQPCQNPEGSFLRQYHVLDVRLWSKQLLVKPRQSETLRHKLDKDTILSSLSLSLFLSLTTWPSGGAQHIQEQKDVHTKVSPYGLCQGPH
uniref:RING-type domain-containing protein n=1 Tax=Timema genevievae TaxID=629358 RepID=A0A7R9PJQ5_TIMGE|nr:unnamed protein product [Timema genevievae]